jgi:hypothetical protein
LIDGEQQRMSFKLREIANDSAKSAVGSRPVG